ncbi:anaphase-promoting complex subunit 5 [Eupeodes corollae]|uniref:anaphase-promoting complex subunit 5 n=1 Tax=Eupeodes corollae TaxID=290404 RepID=UPI00249269F7|nr:anaphase-promoting complex subunit 5 [Eupeodes corollae]
MNHFEELEALDPRNTTFTTSRIDTPTPHKVAIVLLVHQYLKAKQSASELGLIFPAQSRQRFCMLLLKLIQYPDMMYKDLHNLLTSNRYKIDTVHLEGFEKCMSDLNSLGLEYLFDLFEMQNFDKILSDSIGVSQYGIVGLYIRRVAVILDRMSFPEMLSLYENICLYYEKGIRMMAIGPRVSNLLGTCTNNTTESKEETTIEEEESLPVVDNVHHHRNPHSKWSAKQADLFITQQCSLLESNEIRALPPIEMQTKLNEIIQDNPLNSQAFFLTYMNNLRLRDYFSSVDALHRAFDRSPMQMMTNYEHKGFQFFSINLAVMHANFGHREEALESLKECIMLAQENGDKRCLDLANSWYCILNSNKIDPFEKCLPDLQDPCMIQSLSLSIQFVVKVGAQCGCLPLDLFELLQKSDELNCKNSLMDYFSDSLALRSALWNLYGHNEMASMYAQLLLKLKKTWVFGDVGNSESVCMVLCCLALWLNIQGEYALSSVVLHHTKERFPRNPYSNSWMICECYIIIHQSILRCKWQEASRACDQLYVFDENAAILQRVSVLIAKRYLTTARTMLDKLLMSSELDCLTQVRALILLAYSMISQDKVNSEVIGTLNKASTLALQSYLEFEWAITDMMFAQVLLQMQMPQKALQSIKNGMEKIYANGGLYDRAKASFVYMRCLVATALTPEEKKKCLKECSQQIDEAIGYFKKLDAYAKVLDVYSFLATQYNELGMKPERNRYAALFRQYHMEFNIAEEYLNVFF